MLDNPLNPCYNKDTKGRKTDKTRKERKKMENTKKITAREMRFIVKAAIDNALTELVEQYGVDAFQTKTVQRILDTEAATAIQELVELGEIQSLRARENWGAAKA